MFLGILLVAVSARAGTPLRVATYNVKYLDADRLPGQGDRREKIRRVIERLAADVVALQEIDDRRALEEVFDKSVWLLVIDDESRDDQDVALAVRRPLEVANVPPDLDADDEHFLFPRADSNALFPDRRDVLAVDVRVPGEDIAFTVLVVHLKSRYEGLGATNFRRAGAARALLDVLRREYRDRRYVVLGDFNDTPDDEALNVLETGDPSARGGVENSPGNFLENLTEPLYARGHVSFGLTSGRVRGGRVDTVDPEARGRNDRARGTDRHAGRQLFDQILVSPRMLDWYETGSAAVFDGEDAVVGNDRTRASDHVPVYADFVVEARASPHSAGRAVLRIAALVPNPRGRDMGKEEVTIANLGPADADLAGWRLRDRAGGVYPLAGRVPANGTLRVRLAGNRMPLNNEGDDIALVGPDGGVVHAIRYGAEQATIEDTIIRFGTPP